MIVVDDFEFQIKRHDQTVDMRPLLEQAVVDHDVAANIIRISEVAFEELNSKGRTMTLDEVVMFALDGE